MGLNPEPLKTFEYESLLVVSFYDVENHYYSTTYLFKINWNFQPSVICIRNSYYWQITILAIPGNESYFTILLLVIILYGNGQSRDILRGLILDYDL